MRYTLNGLVPFLPNQNWMAILSLVKSVNALKRAGTISTNARDVYPEVMKCVNALKRAGTISTYFTGESKVLIKNKKR